MKKSMVATNPPLKSNLRPNVVSSSNAFSCRSHHTVITKFSSLNKCLSEERLISNTEVVAEVNAFFWESEKFNYHEGINDVRIFIIGICV